MFAQRHVLGAASAAGALLLLLTSGCIGANQELTAVTTGTYVITQSTPVVVQQPRVVVQQPRVVVQQQPVVVSQPVYVSRPTGVMTPVRISIPYQIARRHCVPGTTRTCDAYCGQGFQTCSPDGYSWGACVEGGYPMY